MVGMMIVKGAMLLFVVFDSSSRSGSSCCGSTLLLQEYSNVRMSRRGVDHRSWLRERFRLISGLDLAFQEEVSEYQILPANKSKIHSSKRRFESANFFSKFNQTLQWLILCCSFAGT